MFLNFGRVNAYWDDNDNSNDGNGHGENVDRNDFPMNFISIFKIEGRVPSIGGRGLGIGAKGKGLRTGA